MWGLDEFDNDDNTTSNNIEITENLCSHCQFNDFSNDVNIFMEQNNLNIHYIQFPLHLAYRRLNGNLSDILDYYSNINGNYCNFCLDDYIKNDMVLDKLIFGESKCICCDYFKPINNKYWKRSFHKSLETFQFVRKQLTISNDDESLNLNNYKKYKLLILFSKILRTTKRYYNERAQGFIDDINNNTNGNLWTCSDCYYNVILEKKANRVLNKFKHLPFFNYIDDKRQLFSLKKLSIDALDIESLEHYLKTFSFYLK